MDPRREAEGLRRQIEALGTPERAAAAKAYMRSDLRFTGTKVPDLRRIAATWQKTHRGVDAHDLRRLAEALWKPPVFERRLLAAIFLQRGRRLLQPNDIPWLEAFVRGSKAWAILDTFVPHTLAHVLAKDPAQRKRVLTRWANDDDFWVRRTALLTMGGQFARGDGDWDLWVQLAARNLEDQARWTRKPPSPEERFFIRKALGWALRDRGKHHPGDVVAFVQEHRQHLAGLTLREATRNLPARDKANLGV